MIIWLISGLWVLLGCTEAAHIITLLTDRSLQTFTVLCMVFVLVGLLAYIGLLWILHRKGIITIWDGHGLSASPYMVVFAFFVVLTLAHFIRGYVPDLQDAVYEMTLGNVESGSVMSVHPFLGGPMESGMPFRMQIPCLPGLYAGLITISQQTPYMIMCKAVPIVIWAMTMLLYMAIAGKLFGDDGRKGWLFMSLVAFLFLLTSKSRGLFGYRLFYAGFAGESIRGVLLLPYAMYVSWQRKWLLAVLAVLAEICLVWTTYGVGYCLPVVLCMLVIHLVTDRRVQHAA